jgi:hypothetical protein
MTRYKFSNDQVCAIPPGPAGARARTAAELAGRRARAHDAAPRRRTEHIHVYLPAQPRSRTHDAAAGAPGERSTTGGLPLVRKDQTTEGTPETGFEDQGEGCRVGVGDRFHVRDYRDGVLELVHHPNGTGDGGDPDIVGTRPPGAAGDQRLRRAGRDRLRNLGTNNTPDHDHVAALGELQRELDRHYAKR